MDIWLKCIYQCTTAQQTLVNKVKLYTLKVQHDVQLAMEKFCLSIKECWSQASFNKGSGTKNIGLQGFPSGGTRGIPHHDFVLSIKALPCPTKISRKQ